MRRLVVVTLSFAGLVLLGLLGGGLPAAAAGPTPVCGTLASATWTLAGSPYVVCPGNATTTVPATATITVQPGVTVEFSDTAQFNVAGRLFAIGTLTQPITFTGQTASPGAWRGINLNNPALAPAVAELSYVTLDDGGISGSTQGEIFADNGVLTLTHGLVRHSQGSGVYGSSRTHLSVDSTNFVSNGQDAVRLVDPIGDLPLTNLSASGNAIDGVHVEGTNTKIVGVHTWSNAGLPYIVDDLMGNNPGDSLTIEPGAELRFGPNDGFGVGGQFKAVGQPDQPITLTAQTQSPGMWRGLVVNGSLDEPAVVDLEYATVSYGGSDFAGANVEVDDGQLIARHAVIRGSRLEGVLFNERGNVDIENSQIVSNTVYGVKNVTPNTAVLATNDWWGDPAGPASDVASCSLGHGDRVSNGVLFRPVLTSTNTSVVLPLSAAPQLSLSPRRWFAPANGLTRIFFDITLVDGNGAPLPGRTVKLSTSGVTVHIVDGGITDVTGHTLAFITSANTGDVDVTASLVPSAACEVALSPVAKVTFTTPINLTDLFPDSPAPYLNNNISITPLPLVAGVSATLKVGLTNPLTVPITVDVEFGTAQAGVGLTFGPIADFNGKMIPPGGSLTLTAGWTPPVSGHVCIQVTYNVVSVGGARAPSAPASGAQLRQWNEDIKPAGTTPPDGKAPLDKADKAFKKVEKIPGGPNIIQKGIIDRWWDWTKDSAKKISEALGGDPPRQDYTTISLPISVTWPAVQPSGLIPVERANALNAASAALGNVLAYGNAASIAYDRYGGATAAGDLTWSSQQANAQQYDQQQMGAALLDYADKLDGLITVLNSEGITSVPISVGDVTAYQQRLATTGFTQQEINDAKLVGLTDDDLAAYKADLIAADPVDVAGDLLDVYLNDADTARELGNALLHPDNFAPFFSVSGGAGQAPAATGSNTMVQVYNTTTTLQVGNPLTATTAIDLRPRRINLPADWSVLVSPAQVTLAPHAVTTVTVTILAGSPLPQGSVPSVAVEGYAGSTLLGGVEVGVQTPNYVLFDGRLRLYAPVTRR